MQSLVQWLQQLPRKSRYYGVTAVVTVLCLIGGIVWKTHSAPKVVAEEAPVVRTITIGNSASQAGYTYAGEVRGRYESQLAFQVGGKIIARNVELGSSVAPGDVLMQIDSRDLQQVLNSSSAQVYAAESQRNLAASNLERYRQLLAQGAISQAQYEQYVNSYQVAVAGVQQAAAQQTQGSNQLDYSLLRADKAGIISSITAERGQVVGAGQVVVTIVQDGEREVEIHVPENRVEELRQAQQIKVSLWALGNTAIDGQVREIAPMADAASRTFKVRISLLNPPPALKLGMTASVSVAAANQAAATVFIPLAAVFQDGAEPKVWVVADNTLTLRPIQTGSFGNGTIQVLSGLQAGDCIVTAGVHKLKEGQKVKVGGDTL